MAKAGGKPLTTFVQTGTDTFREVVQRLTGASEPYTKRPTSKLHERRQWTRPKLQIAKPALPFKPNERHSGCCSPLKSGNSSYAPSPVGTPSKIFSELSIAEGEKKEAAINELMNRIEEEKAIRERRFYLHLSPRLSTKPRCAEPELLTLFPLESPKTCPKP